MNLLDLISPRCIRVPLQSKTKKEAIAELVDMLVSVKKLPRRDNIYEALIEREEVGSTGIMHGVALPHAKCAEVKEIYVACGITPEGIDYDALDQKPVHIIFLILAPRSASGQLKVMQILTRFLNQVSYREALIKAANPDEVYSIISEATQNQTAAGTP